MKLTALLLLASLATLSLIAQDRAPATPLITHDPYFSIWSNTDELTASNTRHWNGSPQPIPGLGRIDGKPYRFMGHDPLEVPAMQQTSRAVTPTHTRYAFQAAGVTLQLVFFTPTILSDLDILSRPVTYITWTAQSTDGGSHDVSVLLDVDPIVAVNEQSQPVAYSRNQTATQNLLSVGSRDQNILSRSGDNLRIDWCYFHLSIPKNEQSNLAIVSQAHDTFVSTGQLPAAHYMEIPITAW